MSNENQKVECSLCPNCGRDKRVEGETQCGVIDDICECPRILCEAGRQAALASQQLGLAANRAGIAAIAASVAVVGLAGAGIVRKLKLKLRLKSEN